MADSKKPLCFVVGPIGRDGSIERKHSDMLLHALIKHVLVADEFGYVVKRADEDADPGMISDRVISDIIHADLVIADLTDLNANAFYELGIRHSTEKPTIHVAKAGTLLPFDTLNHRTIFVDLADWHSLESARERIANSARTIKLPDYKVSNPITQANASFEMRQSKDPILASIQERLDSLEAERGRRPSRQRDVFIEPRPKGQPEGSAIEDYVVEDRANRVLATFKTVGEANDWSYENGYMPQVQRWRHLNDKNDPGLWTAIAP
jgi:hypothetical protein